jgi:hypothetical protein
MAAADGECRSASDLQGPRGDGEVRERPGAEPRAASAAGAWRGPGEGGCAMVCNRAQPAAGGESARGAGDARLEPV